MRRVQCPECRGSGRDIVFRNQMCGRCGGSGFIMEHEPDNMSRTPASEKRRRIERIVYLLVVVGIIGFILYKLSR